MPLIGQHQYLRLAEARPAWHDHAACRNHPRPDAWFPTNKRGTNAEAQRICNTCPVRPECLHHAVTHNEQDGIWGSVPAPVRQHQRVTNLRGVG